VEIIWQSHFQEWKKPGKIVMPKTQNGEWGFIAVFSDTEGNKIGNVQSSPL
jgi:predicted enzyme related to lactoylglutathione lyase